MPIVTPIAVTDSSDWHSGWSFIPFGRVVKIAEFRQSLTFGTLDLEGTLVVEGKHIVED